MRFFYDLFIHLYGLGIRLASLKSDKARRFLTGRKDWKSKLQSSLDGETAKIWVHVASLGEYEQALPVLEKLHQSYPDYQFVLTFFSPSGYEHAKLPSFIPNKHYLPLDTALNARKFLDLVKPSMILFVKYDIWFHFLNEAAVRKIPAVLFSALFRENQAYFKFYGSLMRKALKSFNHIYVQNSKSLELLRTIGMNGEIAGDTRYDRVRSRMEHVQVHPVISGFCKEQKAVVFGSTWKDDLEVVLPYINSSKEKIIIAPHNIGRTEVDFIVTSITRKVLRFSDIDESTLISDFQVLVIDNIGMLASVYSQGKIAYVGGAFHGSLHNILEPAVFGIPVIFGPNHSKFPEAKAMISAGCGFEISDAKEFSEQMDRFKSGELLKSSGQNASEFVRSNLGSSEIIFKGIHSLMENNKGY